MATRSVKSAQARRALERRLGPLRSLSISHETARPSGGWVRAIRESLGMSSLDLAERLGVAVSSVTRLERSEQTGGIQLNTLRRVADELECDLVYVLVPRRPLEQVVEDRARKLARQELASLGHTMDLEAQGLGDDRMRERLDSLTEDLKSQPGLWRATQDA